MQQNGELSQQKIRDNLAKYSPFYRQSLLFDRQDTVKTFIHVSHLDSNTEEDLKKIQAFDLDDNFYSKKIIFANLVGAQGSRAGGHWDVVVKNRDGYSFEKHKVAGDGKCGFVSSVLILSEICEDINERWTLDHLLQKISRPQYQRDENGDDLEIGEAEQYEVHPELVEYLMKVPLIPLIPSHLIPLIPSECQPRIVSLLTQTGQDYLSSHEVHEILTKSKIYQDALSKGRVQNLSNQKLINSNLEGCTTFSNQGSMEEGLCLDANSTLKSEFRNIVLNIVHENKDSLRFDTDLEELVKNKLGEEFTNKIKQELGGKINFNNLFLATDSNDVELKFYSQKMNLSSVPALTKIAEILQHYSALSDDSQNLQEISDNIRVFGLFCNKLEQIEGIKESDKEKFLGLKDLFAKRGEDLKAEPSYSEVPPYKEVPSISELKWLETISDNLKLIIDPIINSIDSSHKEIENFIKRSFDNSPTPSPESPRAKNFFEIMSSLCCGSSRGDQ